MSTGKIRKGILIWRIVIVVVAGILVFALSGPEKGSVEWHKKEFRAAWDGTSPMDYARRIWWKVSGRIYTLNYQAERLAEHEKALLDAGYWEQRVFVVSNQSPVWVMRELYGEGRVIVPESELYVVRVEDANSVTVLAMPRYIPQFEAAVRELDAP